MKDIIFSEWQFVTVFFSVVALLAMIVGRYSVKTTVISSVVAVVANFAIISSILYMSVSPASTQQNTEKVNIEERLNEVFEGNKESTKNKELVALVEPISENGDLETHVYVKNFHEEWEFKGKVRVAMYDENDKVIKEEVFDVSLDPEETDQIESDFGVTTFDWFRYEFYPEEN